VLLCGGKKKIVGPADPEDNRSHLLGKRRGKTTLLEEGKRDIRAAGEEENRLAESKESSCIQRKEISKRGKEKRPAYFKVEKKSRLLHGAFQ